MSILQEIQNLIGQVPAGFAGLAWVVSALIFLFIVMMAFGAISALIRAFTRWD